MLPTLSSHHIVLRTPRRSDALDRAAAGRDPEFRRMVGATPAASLELTREEAEHWVDSLLREPYGWVIEFEHRCIGVARLHGVDMASRRAQLALGIFAPEYRGRGFGTQAVRLLVRYAFDHLALGALRLRVLEFNTRAIACYRKCGFVEVGREESRIDGESVTDILMECAPADFTRTMANSGQSTDPRP